MDFLIFKVKENLKDKTKEDKFKAKITNKGLLNY